MPRLPRALLILSLLLVASVALGAGHARAAAGRDVWIAAEANALSNRSLSVTCSIDTQDWRRALTAVGFPAKEAGEYYGFSLIEQGQMHLSPYVCAGLQLGIAASTRRANEQQVAWSVDVLVHESVHMARHTADEALTEACARAGLPLELHRLYDIAYGSAELRRLTAAAATFRQTMGSAYQHGVCPPA